MSALIRDAVGQVYGSRRDLQQDLDAIDAAFGAWQDRDFDGEPYVEALRTGERLRAVTER